MAADSQSGLRDTDLQQRAITSYDQKLSVALFVKGLPRPKFTDFSILLFLIAGYYA